LAQKVLEVLVARLALLVDKEFKANAVQADQKELTAQEAKTDSTVRVAQMALPANQANLACLDFKENKATMDLLAEADLLVNLVCQAPLDCRDDPDLKDSMDSLDLMDHKDRKEALVQLALASTARDTTKLTSASCEKLLF